MSTDFYLVCDICKEVVDAATRTMGMQSCQTDDAVYALVPFIAYHGHCTETRIASENAPVIWEENYLEWTKDNYKQLADREVKE